MAETYPAQEIKGVLMNRDFDHLLADHLSARERAAQGFGEVERDPAVNSERAARSGGYRRARGGRAARGAALLMAWFR